MVLNTILAAYAHHNEGWKGVQTYLQMQVEMVEPDPRTFVSVTQACASLAEIERNARLDANYVKVESLQIGKELHANVVFRGFESHMFISNTLVTMYAKCGSILDAEQVFCMLSHCDLVSWNLMLAAYSQMGMGQECLQFYQAMQEEGVIPDAWSLASALQACSTLAEKEDATLVQEQSRKIETLYTVKELHAQGASMNLEGDVVFGGPLICAYQRCGCLKDAEDVFSELCQHDVSSWNAMIEAYARGDEGEQALEMYGRMQATGVKGDVVTFLSVLDACSKVGALETCVHIHQSIVSCGLECSLSLSTSLIHAYSRIANMEAAQRVFNLLPFPDVVAWTALIAGYASQGDCQGSIKCYEDMCAAGLKPDRVTFLALLSACNHAGLVDKGLEYFESMSKDHSIEADLEHYVCILDLVGRAGYLTKAKDLLKQMPMQPNFSVWLCLLGICQKQGDVELGRLAFEGAVGFQPKNSGIYVLMSNIYCQAGMWDCAKEVDQLRQDAGAWKKPGLSWIEHDQELHTFFVGGDCRHQDAALIFRVLMELSPKLFDTG